MCLILIIIFITIFFSYKYLGKLGLKLSLILLTILSFIMSFKIGLFFGIDTNISVIPYASIFVLLYILIEKYSAQEIKKDITLTIKTSIFTTLIFLIFISYTQSVNDQVIINIDHLIKLLPILSTFIILPLSILLTTKLYKYFNKINENKYINIIICTIAIALIESIIQSILSYFLVLNINEIMNISLANYLFKIIIIIVSLPFINLMIKKKVISWILF